MLNRRILIVDDNADIHVDFRKVLLPKKDKQDAELTSLEDHLFGDEEATQPEELALDWSYEIDSAYQGLQALQMVEEAARDGNPYALVFMDVRMPPGWDGVETIGRVWDKVPNTEIVICTAYSDYTADNIISALGVSHRLLFLKKPFDPLAVKQMALAITTKWNFEATSRTQLETLEQTVQARTQELNETVKKLTLTNQELDMSLNKLGETQTLLLQSSKMSALGEMAAGVAHEVNNPLAIIHTTASQLQELLQEEPLDRPLIIQISSCIEETANRIAKIIDGLRSFSRDGTRDPFQSYSVKKIIDETMALCSEKLKNNGIDLRIPKTPDTLVIECRATQIGQALLNLLNNAYDAIQFLPEKWIQVEVEVNKDDLEIRVTDSGAGVPEESRKRLFQPFFTTKEIGKGTGLGLSISKGIAEAHGGTFTLNTGCINTQFAIRLPKIQGTRAKGAAA